MGKEVTKAAGVEDPEVAATGKTAKVMVIVKGRRMKKTRNRVKAMHAFSQEIIPQSYLLTSSQSTAQNGWASEASAMQDTDSALAGISITSKTRTIIRPQLHR